MAKGQVIKALPMDRGRCRGHGRGAYPLGVRTKKGLPDRGVASVQQQLGDAVRAAIAATRRRKVDSA